MPDTLLSTQDWAVNEQANPYPLGVCILVAGITYMALAICTWHLPLQGFKSCTAAAADLQHPPERNSGWSRYEALCTLGKSGRTDLQIVRYFQEPILWAQFSYLLISRKARKILHGDNCVLWLTETCKKRCAWSYLLPFYQNHILTDLSLLPLWSSLRATWNVASQAIVFILPQYKVTCKSHVVHFFKVSPGNE